MERTEIKEKPCKRCGTKFTPYRSFDRHCSTLCKSQDEKDRLQKKKEHQEKTQGVTLKHLKQVAQISFNAYVRERDKGKPCICCGKTLGADYDAGHCFSGAGHANVLFDEDNVHAQRRECNQGTKSGNYADYCERLEILIGPERFEVLRAEAYVTKSWTKEELVRIAAEYKNKLNQLKQR